MYVIEVVNSVKKCWIADWEGDPPRTLKIENAKKFVSIEAANKTIEEVRKTHPFKDMSYKVMKASNSY